MQRISRDDPEARSADLVADNIDRLRELFPEAFTEGKVDFDVLRDLLGDAVDDGEEKYGLNWKGKRLARRLALTPSMGTLRPCPEESVDWGSTQNLMIEGDNLEVLKLLQKSYAGKVKLIYIDPPYNTGKDFVYPDNYQDGIKNYLRITGQADDDGQKTTSNPETSGRFHTNWLNMMYPRLKVARNLLRNDGVIFISIDENEDAQLRGICDEIFGGECFIGELPWKKKSGGGGDVGSIVIDHEYILCYGRTPGIALKNDPNAEVATQYNKIDSDGRRYSLDRLDKQSLGYQESLDFAIAGPDGSIYKVIHNDSEHKVARWRWSKKTVAERYDELVFEWPYVYTKNYEKLDGARPRSLLIDERFGRTRTGKTDLKAIFDMDIMDFPKPVRLISYLLNITTESEDIALDFFAGSAPLGQAVLEQNKQTRFILVQFPEKLSEKTQTGKNALSLGMQTIADIGKERLRRVIERTTPDSATDLGFRVFKLDSSNFKTWDPNPGGLEASLLDSIEHVKERRTSDDILFELLLKQGIDLCAPIATREIAGKIVHAIEDGDLLVCLAESVAQDEVERLALGIANWHAEIRGGGSKIIFLDSAFENDVAKTNLVEILRQRGVGYVRSV